MAEGNLTLSTWEEVEILLALVLNFVATLGAMSKGFKRNKNKNQGHTTLGRVRAQDNMKFKKCYDAWCKYTYDAWSNALKQFSFTSILKIDQEN